MIAWLGFFCALPIQAAHQREGRCGPVSCGNECRAKVRDSASRYP
jgi:hypothetical protein